MAEPGAPNRRNNHTEGPTLVGLPVRDGDVESTRSVHWVAILFRILAGLLFLLMVFQVIDGMTSAVALSVGILVAESVRLVIFAGLLWGVGDLADLFVKSHYDLRATRILLERLAHRDDGNADTWTRGKAS